MTKKNTSNPAGRNDRRTTSNTEAAPALMDMPERIKIDAPRLKAVTFSPGVKVGKLLFISGQVSIDPAKAVSSSAGMISALALSRFLSILRR